MYRPRGFDQLVGLGVMQFALACGGWGRGRPVVCAKLHDICASFAS